MAVILSPDQYSSASTYDLLRTVALGHASPDHRMLRVILDRGEAVLPDMLRFLKEGENEENEEYRFETDEFVLDIARALRSPATLPFLIEFASQHSSEFPDELTLAFAELGPAAVEPLLELHKQPEMASDAAFTLAALGVRDQRILELLLRELEANPYETAINLDLYRDPAAKPALEAAMAKAADEATRRCIANAIEDLDSERVTEEEPFDIWAKYPEEAEPPLEELEDEELEEFLDSPVAAYRARAVQMLGFSEPEPKRTARILDLARTDPDVEVRAEAWEALDPSFDQPNVREAAESRLNDPSAPVVERAAIAVGMAAEKGREEPLHGIIRKLYEIPEVRARAIKAMWHSLDRRFAEYIPRHLDDPDPEVRRQAVLAVGWLGIVSQLRRIEQLFQDDELRGSALYAYCLAAPGEVTPARTRALFRKIEDLVDGLSDEESRLVRSALDDRLQLHGHERIFTVSDEWGEEEEEFEPEAPAAKVGRNDPCPCGSGKKYKKCCGQ